MTERIRKLRAESLAAKPYITPERARLVTEFYRSKERSLCCEGGGGKMWVESESKAPRLAETRVADAHDLGAQTIAVACPFCWLTIEDAIKAKGFEEEMRVMDILELLDEAL